jgi:hypothetical protein
MGSLKESANSLTAALEKSEADLEVRSEHPAPGEVKQQDRWLHVSTSPPRHSDEPLPDPLLRGTVGTQRGQHRVMRMPPAAKPWSRGARLTLPRCMGGALRPVRGTQARGGFLPHLRQPGAPHAQLVWRSNPKRQLPERASRADGAYEGRWGMGWGRD